MFLTFDKCLNRLKHSFLKTAWADYIDFQHPSIRDMLLNILKDDPNTKRKFIMLASPDGLSDIIEGIPLYRSSTKKEIHKLILKDTEELKLLCDRIKVVINESIPSDDFKKILNSVINIIPKKDRMIIQPKELDLSVFLKTPVGMIINTTVNAVAEQRTFESKTSYSLSEWNLLLDRYYEIYPYSHPDTNIKYLNNLCELIETSKNPEIINFFYYLYKYSQALFRQTFNEDIDDKFDSYIISNISDLYRIGEKFVKYLDKYRIYMGEYGGLRNYEDWEYDAIKFIELAEKYYIFSSFSHPEGLKDLDNLIGKLHPLGVDLLRYEKEKNDAMLDYYHEFDESENFWTIEKIFEDI